MEIHLYAELHSPVDLLVFVILYSEGVVRLPDLIGGKAKSGKQFIQSHRENLSIFFIECYVSVSREPRKRELPLRSSDYRMTFPAGELQAEIRDYGGSSSEVSNPEGRYHDSDSIRRIWIDSSFPNADS